MTEALQSKITNVSNTINELEKAERSLIQKLSKWKGYQLNKYLSEIDGKRKMEYNDIKKVLDLLSSQLQEKVAFFNEGVLKVLDTENFKNEMITIQSTIEDLKKSSIANLDHLQKEEAGLTNEIESVQQTLDVLFDHNLFIQKRVKKETIADEIKVAKELLKRKYGENKAKTMDIKPYAELIKLFNCYQNLDKVLDKFKENGSEIPEEDIMDFNVFLKNVNKDISTNKNNKTLENSTDRNARTEVKKKIDNYLDVDHLKQLLKLKNARVKKHVKSPKQVGVHHREFSKDENMERINKKVDNFLNVEELKEKLYSWKVEQTNRVKCLEALENFNKAECLRKELIEKRRRSQFKKQIQKWKEENKKMDEFVKKQNMMGSRIFHVKKNQREIKKNIKMYQTRDKSYIQKMRQTKKNIVPLPMSQKQNKLISKKPTTILKSTSQWMNRLKDKSNRISQHNNLQNIPKLAIPEWRKLII